MDLNLGNLKYFFDTMKNGSVQNAAKVNHVSQPAISQGIRKLEEQIGFDLLNHQRNKISPTARGRQLFSYSKNVFCSIKELKDNIEAMKDEISGEIRIGCSNSTAKAIVFPKLKAFEKKFPKIDFKLKIGKTDIQADLIDGGEIDFGVAIDNGNLKKFTKVPLYRGRFLLVGKKKAPRRVLTTELRPEILTLQKALGKKGEKLDSLEIESWNLLYEMSLNGLGYAFVPDFLVSQNDKLIEFQSEPMLPTINYEAVAFFARKTRLSKVSELFIGLLSEKQ